MSEFEFEAIPTAHARHVQGGGRDAHDRLPYREISDGLGNQCRHCLEFIPQDQAMLIFAYKPFETTQAFAEIGPVFVCASECKRAKPSGNIPQMYFAWDCALIRGYDINDRIVYGTGRIVEMDLLEKTLAQTFENSSIEYVHLRSSQYGCYQCRINRAA